MHFVRCKLILPLFATIFFAHVYGMEYEEDEVKLFHTSEQALSIESEEVNEAPGRATQEVAQALVDVSKENQFIQNENRKKKWNYSVICDQEGCSKVFHAEHQSRLTQRLLRHWSGKKHNEHYQEGLSYVKKNRKRKQGRWEVFCEVAGCKKRIIVTGTDSSQLTIPYVTHRYGTVLHSPKTFEKAKHHVAAHTEENVK